MQYHTESFAYHGQGYSNQEHRQTFPVRDGLSRDIMRRAISAPYLERDEEHELALRWKGEHDQKALHKMAEAHMRLVVSIATKFRRFNLPLADLVQEGYVGLLEAAARFEPEREVRFSTYATWWIRASIQDYILRNWSIVRGGTSSAQKALFFNLRRLRAKIVQEDETLSREDIYKRISSQLGVSINDVATMDFRLAASDDSLNAPLGGAEEGSTSSEMDALVDDAPLQDERVAHEIDGTRRSKWLGEALQVLNERELYVIRARRLSNEPITLEALGEELGVSKERIRQIETRALEKLRTALLQRNDAIAYQSW